MVISWTFYYLYIFVLFRRSLWIDEIQAIQISRTTSIKDILPLLKYERHPIGWYLLLKILNFASIIFSLRLILLLKIFQVITMIM